MKKIRIEFNINDDAAKNVEKAAKNFVKAITGLFKGHGADVKVEDVEDTKKTKK